MSGVENSSKKSKRSSKADKTNSTSRGNASTHRDHEGSALTADSSSDRRTTKRPDRKDGKRSSRRSGGEGKRKKKSKDVDVDGSATSKSQLPKRQAKARRQSSQGDSDMVPHGGSIDGGSDAREGRAGGSSRRISGSERKRGKDKADRKHHDGHSSSNNEDAPKGSLRQGDGVLSSTKELKSTQSMPPSPSKESSRERKSRSSRKSTDDAKEEKHRTSSSRRSHRVREKTSSSNQTTTITDESRGNVDKAKQRRVSGERDRGGLKEDSDGILVRRKKRSDSAGDGNVGGNANARSSHGDRWARELMDSLYVDALGKSADASSVAGESSYAMDDEYLSDEDTTFTKETLDRSERVKVYVEQFYTRIGDALAKAEDVPSSNGSVVNTYNPVEQKRHHQQKESEKRKRKQAANELKSAVRARKAGFASGAGPQHTSSTLLGLGLGAGKNGQCSKSYASVLSSSPQPGRRKRNGSANGLATAKRYVSLSPRKSRRDADSSATSEQKHSPVAAASTATLLSRSSTASVESNVSALGDETSTSSGVVIRNGHTDSVAVAPLLSSSSSGSSYSRNERKTLPRLDAHVDDDGGGGGSGNGDDDVVIVDDDVIVVDDDDDDDEEDEEENNVDAPPKVLERHVKSDTTHMVRSVPAPPAHAADECVEDVEGLEEAEGKHEVENKEREVHEPQPHKTHHEEDIPPQEVVEKREKKEVVPCTICGKRFYNDVYLMQHMLARHHHDDGENVWEDGKKTPPVKHRPGIASEIKAIPKDMIKAGTSAPKATIDASRKTVNATTSALGLPQPSLKTVTRVPGSTFRRFGLSGSYKHHTDEGLIPLTTTSGDEGSETPISDEVLNALIDKIGGHTPGGGGGGAGGGGGGADDHGEGRPEEDDGVSPPVISVHAIQVVMDGIRAAAENGTALDMSCTLPGVTLGQVKSLASRLETRQHRQQRKHAELQAQYDEMRAAFLQMQHAFAEERREWDLSLAKIRKIKEQTDAEVEATTELTHSNEQRLQQSHARMLALQEKVQEVRREQTMKATSASQLWTYAYLFLFGLAIALVLRRKFRGE